jgi:NifU-like protein involved in Fe-S cluster formation
MSIWDLTDEDRKQMKKAGFSNKALDYFNDRTYQGELENPSVCHTESSYSGERLRLCLKIQGGRIIDGSYIHQGCPALVASAAATIDLVVGKTIKDASSLTNTNIWQVLGSLPQGHNEHVDFCLQTLQKTLMIFSKQKQFNNEEHDKYVHFCGLSGKELETLSHGLCSNCELVQNCENDHILIE